MSFSTTIDEAVSPLVLALDVGSTGTRGGLYDARGLPVKGAKFKVPHAFTTAGDGTSTIDADQVTDEIRTCIDHCATQFDAPIAGVALDTFAASLVGVDAEHRAITPTFTYADSRCAPQVSYLRATVDEDETQQRTGTRQHTSYLPARFLWLKENHADLFARARRWLSLGEYAWLRIIGTTAAGTSTAAWTGMLDRHTCTWDEPLAAAVGVPVEKLSPIAHPSQPLRPAIDIAQTWPTLAGAVWFAPVSDGHTQSFGAGATDSSRLVLSAATSGALRRVITGAVDDLPRGLWCYRLDEERSILGGAINDVGRAMTWLEQTLRLPEPEILMDYLNGDPHTDTPLVLPWFTGERSTGWIGDARAVLAGVSAASTPLELYRGTVEGIALAYQRMLTELLLVEGRPAEIVGTGRVTLDHPGLLQMIADATGAPVTPVTIKRSTLHGTALHAVDVLAPTVERADVTRAETLTPHPERRGYYRRRVERFRVLYDKVYAR